ncbi:MULTISPECIES: hypothetical protein [Streptomyces]|uniref:Uncharacterized protein n=1 Tax=Streptomyces ramulosus TaxID=47762 RepID=A0ABW1FAT5_9ACTN
MCAITGSGVGTAIRLLSPLPADSRGTVEHGKVDAERVRTVPEPGDLSLCDAASALLMESGGIREAWALPGTEGPLIIDVFQGPRRLHIGFRYLLVTHSSFVSSAVLDGGLARWVALDQVDDHIAARLRPHAAATAL